MKLIDPRRPYSGGGVEMSNEPTIERLVAEVRRLSGCLLVIAGAEGCGNGSLRCAAYEASPSDGSDHGQSRPATRLTCSTRTLGYGEDGTRSPVWPTVTEQRHMR